MREKSSQQQYDRTPASVEKSLSGGASSSGSLVDSQYRKKDRKQHTHHSWSPDRPDPSGAGGSDEHHSSPSIARTRFTSRAPPSPRHHRPPARAMSTFSLTGSSVANLAPWERRFTSTKEVFTDFCARTSSHGIPHIGESYTLAGKVFWACVFATCGIAFAVQTYWTVDQYLDYKSIFEMQLVFEAAPFPAVTFCNLNPYKATLVEDIPDVAKSLLVYEQNIVRARQQQSEQSKAWPKAADKAMPVDDDQATEALNNVQNSIRFSRDLNEYLSDDAEIRIRSIFNRANVSSIFLSRSRRKVNVTLYMTQCRCKSSKDMCISLMDDRLNDPQHRNILQPDVRVCTCFYTTQQSTPWPCYQNSEWIEARCPTVNCSSLAQTCRYPTHAYYPPGTRVRTTSCYCSHTAKLCVKWPEGMVPEWFDLNKVNMRTMTTTDTPPSTTPNQNERDAMGLEDLKDKGAITTKTKENIMFVVAALDPEVRVNVSYTKEELIKRCSFNGRDCIMDSDIRLSPDPMYGNCYKFNYDKDVVVKNTRAGPMYGLRLLLDVQQKEYLPYTEAAGIRIIVHDPADEAFPDTFGYSAPVGFISSFGIKTKVVQRMGRPYTNCTFAEKKIDNYIYDEHYSSEGCYRNCFQHMLIANCSCGDPRFPAPEGSRACTAFNPVERNCLYNFQDRHGSFQQISTCSCEQPCNEVVYETSYSAAAWPADNFLIGECPDELLMSANDSSACTEYFRKNTAYIEVFYEQLNYELLKETQAYSFINLMADFGGNIGLWIGFSVITMIEILELCMELFYLCYFRGKREEERRQRKRNRLRMRQNLQYLNRLTELATAAPFSSMSEGGDAIQPGETNFLQPPQTLVETDEENF